MSVEKTVDQELNKLLEPVAEAEGVSIEELKKKLAEGNLLEPISSWFSTPKHLRTNFAIARAIEALSRGEMPSSDTNRAQRLKALRQDKHVVVKEIAYRSSIEDIYPLYAEIAYDPERRNMPIAVIQHGGYPGTRCGWMFLVPSCYRMARKGLFALAVSKRGRDGSAGVGDSWCKEIFDIVDAVEYVKKEYAEYVDPTNVNIWGYSGGSYDSISAAVRFPDYFRSVNPFFSQLQWNRTFSVETEEGQSLRKVFKQQKYDEWLFHDEAFKKDFFEKYGGRPDSNLMLGYLIMKGIGGWPEEVPDNYMARNNILAVINNPYSKIHMISDESDLSCRWDFNEYYKRSKELGYTNVEFHYAKKGDKFRYHHGGPRSYADLGNPDLLEAERYFIQDILSGSYPEPVLADRGKLVVLGYVKTKRFFVWLGGGNDAVAELDYELHPFESIFRFKRLTQNKEAKGRLTYPNPEEYPLSVWINNKQVASPSIEKNITVEFGLNDKVKIQRELAIKK